MHWDYTHFTGSQALHMYLECPHPNLNHDNITEALMVALIGIRGNNSIANYI